ncbi:MAG: N-methyl-L-tryptophan oxidase [Chitinophagaceae bacterium]|nr:N-methyl-L-tryptophan oxidase [Chitinophagaceae bacterium]MCA6514098.1 N-methyl-L-tryptophan oxidase [Chitinophagaceae bacterium]
MTDGNNCIQEVHGNSTESILSTRELTARVKAAIDRTREIPTQFDVIVLGVGSMGAATCYQLAERGYKVLGLEQFDIPHELGSHGGQSRIIRKAYAEHPDYVPLLERAYQNWKSLEEITGEQVYFKTGLLYSGKTNDPFIKGVKLSSEKYNIPVEELSQVDAQKRYPQFKLPDGNKQLLEPDAGFVTPERSILLFTEQAIKKGALIRTREKVNDWKRVQGTITVTTDKGQYCAKKLVITAGPWGGKMIPQLARHLTVTKQIIAWMKPKKWDDFTLGNFPCWIIEHGGHDYYGFPILPEDKPGGPSGMKLAVHFPLGEPTDPDAVNRKIRDVDEKVLIDALQLLIPDGYESTLSLKTCLYTNSPDQHFIIDHLPGYEKDVAIAAGFSGHGFKFVSVVGEVMADLAMNGQCNLPIEFLSIGRLK